MDLPSYSAASRGGGPSGFTDVAPAVKWQVSPLPGKFDLSLVAGLALPTGAVAIAGRGAQPYLQFPWSLELHDGWGFGGMFTEFLRPEDFTARSITETTFVLERKLTEKFSVFTEYVGDYPQGGGPSQLWNSGGAYHLDRTHQVDFRIGIGLNHNAPTYVAGIGYSFRLDGLFGTAAKPPPPFP